MFGQEDVCFVHLGLFFKEEHAQEDAELINFTLQQEESVSVQMDSKE